MKTVNALLYAFILMVLFSCQQEVKPINYGKDPCHYCRMNIVDQIHGAELITDKGKVYKFDAVECLVGYYNQLESTEGVILLTNHFESPQALIPVKSATFLISKNLPSPMGANLTAFSSKAVAEEVKKEKGGALYTWSDLPRVELIDF